MINLEIENPIIKNQEYYNSLADKIESLNIKNIQHIGYIVSDLRKGDIDAAKADCFNQSDKFSAIPEIKEIIKNELFEKGEEHPWHLFEK